MQSVVLFVVLAALVLVAAKTQSQSGPTGSIEGVVLDLQGQPVAGATVFVGTMLRGPFTKTGSERKFVLADVPAGTAGLNAFKEADGYPYNMSSFFIVPGEIMPKVDVIAGGVVKNVTVQLGAKAACLKLDVTGESGTPISAYLSFSRPDLGRFGDYRTSMPASKSVMVPPVPFRLAVESNRYEAWHYIGEKGDLVVLKSSETLSLHVQLKKAH
ncbi:MAG: carboxypeptidase-like regulatory domain-containing protein [Terriglobales bacterium]